MQNSILTEMSLSDFKKVNSLFIKNFFPVNKVDSRKILEKLVSHAVLYYFRDLNEINASLVLDSILSEGNWDIFFYYYDDETGKALVYVATKTLVEKYGFWTNSKVTEFISSTAKETGISTGVIQSVLAYLLFPGQEIEYELNSKISN